MILVQMTFSKRKIKTPTEQILQQRPSATKITIELLVAVNYELTY